MQKEQQFQQGQTYRQFNCNKPGASQVAASVKGSERAKFKYAQGQLLKNIS